MVLDDEICKKSIEEIEVSSLNWEQKNLLFAMKTGFAKRVISCIKLIKWKKEIFSPFLNTLLKNKTFRNLYILIRGRKY